MLRISNMISMKYEEKDLKEKYLKYSYWSMSEQNFRQSYRVRDDVIFLPRNMVKFKNIFPNQNLLDASYEYCTRTVSQEISLLNKFALRSYQQKAFEQIKNFHNEGKNDVILTMPSSAGKTYMLSAYIKYLQQKTLILVDQTLLQTQIFNEISTNTNAKVQVITRKTTKVADVNIVTLQLLMRNKKLLDLFKNHIGSIVLDEAHIVSTRRISAIIQFFPAKYRLALSATPTRSDGLDEMIYDIFSNNIVKAKNPIALGVKIQRIVFGEKFYFSSAVLYKKELVRFLTKDSLRKRILQLTRELSQSGRTILIAINSIDAQRDYQKLLKRVDKNAIVFNGNVNQNKREETLKNIELGKHKIILGFNVLEKGISIPRLDTIIHLSGASTKEKVQQLIGRLTREHHEKKEPLFIEMLFGGDLEGKEQIRMDTYLSMIKNDEKIYLGSN